MHLQILTKQAMQQKKKLTEVARCLQPKGWHPKANRRVSQQLA